MKLKFKIDGLDCANCANELESSIASLEEVKTASISFMTQRMIIETNTNDIEALVKKNRINSKKRRTRCNYYIKVGII